MFAYYYPPLSLSGIIRLRKSITLSPVCQRRGGDSPSQTAPAPASKKWYAANRLGDSPGFCRPRRSGIILLSIQQKSPRRIGHLGDFTIGQVSNLLIGQVSNLYIGQVTNSRRSARAIASARLETPSLDRMLLTCALAVERLTVNRSAISGLFNPSTIRASTSRSRGVRS